MDWTRILAYVTGTVDQELLLRNEYLDAENRILRGQLKGRLRFSDAERAKLGEIGRRLGRKALGEVANVAVLAQKCIWSRTRVVADRGRRFSSAARQIGRQLRLERHAWKFWKPAHLSKAVANGTGCHADTDVSVQ